MHKKYHFLVGSINEIDVKMVNNQLPSNYAYYKVDGAPVTEKTHTLQVGDYYLKDDSLLSESVTLTDAQEAACIGIVYWAGDANT